VGKRYEAPILVRRLIWLTGSKAKMRDIGNLGLPGEYISPRLPPCCPVKEKKLIHTSAVTHLPVPVSKKGKLLSYSISSQSTFSASVAVGHIAISVANYLQQITHLPSQAK